MAQAQPVAQQVRASSDKVLAVRASRVRWRIFAIIFALTVINLVDRVSLSIAMPIIAKEFTLSPSMQGLILSSFFWAYALLQIPGGWLIDRYGPRRVIGWSTGLWGTFQTLAAFATGGLSLMFARVALGAAEAPLFPAGGKLNSLWLGSGERSRGAVPHHARLRGDDAAGRGAGWLVDRLHDCRTRLVADRVLYRRYRHPGNGLAGLALPA